MSAAKLIAKAWNDETEKMRKEYFNLDRYMQAQLEESRENLPEDAQLLRVSEEVAKLEKFQVARGTYLPDRVIRDLTTADANGAALINGTEITDWAAALRNRSTVTLAGAVPYQAVGNSIIPVITSGAVAYWPGEGSVVTATTPTIAQITAAPNPVGASIDVSKQLLKLSPVTKALLTTDIVNCLIEAIDTAALVGAGTSEPTGLKNTALVNAASLSTIDMADIWDVVYTTEASKAPGPYSWIMHPAVAKILRKRLRDAENTASGYLMGDELRLAGYPVYLTNALAADEMCFGPFGQMGIVRWGRTDLLINPYSQGKAGMAEITAFIYCDVVVKRPAAFTWITSVA